MLPSILKKNIYPCTFVSYVSFPPCRGFRSQNECELSTRVSKEQDALQHVPGQSGMGRPAVPLSWDRKVSLSSCPFVPGQEHPFWQKSADWLNLICPVRSAALKRTPVENFNSFSAMFYCMISTTHQKIGDLFCPFLISGL